MRIIISNLLMCFIISFTSAAYVADVSVLLNEADTLKSANREQFANVMLKLEDLKSSFTPTQGSFYRYLEAYSVAFQGDFPSAIELFQQLVNEEGFSDTGFRARATLINIFTLAKRFNDAFSLSEDVLLNMSDLAEPKAREQSFRVIALLHNTVGDYQSGNFYADIVIRESTDATSKCAAWQVKVESMYHLKQYAKFNSEVEQALSSCKSADSKLFEVIILAYKARQLEEISKNKEALQLLLSNLDNANATQFPQVISGYNALIARSYLREEDLNNAERYALRAIEFGLNTDYSEPLTWAYETLYIVNKLQHKYSDALKYHEIFLDFDKAYIDKLSAGQLALHIARSASQVKSQQIELLNKDNELLSLQRNIYAQDVRQHRLVMLLLFSILLIASFMAYRGMSGRKRFKKIAEYDQLTGISNRYHFNNQAKVALDYCELDAKPAALILFDLDYFKNINDQYGHAAGDWALQQVVKTCRNFMRNNDVFGRIGGEEFAVVLPGCHADKAALMAEICRDAIATIDTKDSGYTFPLSASFGVSSSDTSGYQLKQLLADADLAMYKAKQSGRDQVSMYAENLS